MTSWEAVERQVRERADGRCEYCRMHESLQGATFHIEHVVPRSRGGDSSPENLAWACPRCNLCKSNRVEVPDPESGQRVPLFNPRTDRWGDHFRWDDYRVVPLSAIGDADLDKEAARAKRLDDSAAEVSRRLVAAMETVREVLAK